MHRFWPIVVCLPLAAADEFEPARSVLERRCVACHNARTKVSGLDLSSREAALRGGSKGPAVNLSAPEASPLLARVESGQMPPAAKLPAAERDALRRWIKAGAPWTGSIEVRRAGPDWWSLQPLGDYAPDIDRWVREKLAANGLAPSPPAGRRTLIRRVTFGLLGLPPKPEEIEAFVSDARPDAWERLVDRLLASPHYGEHWARHWLDVARYAESEGFERDWLRDHAWRYRDYVIRALNADIPYTQFAREQIAGDIIEPVTHDSIAATGLLVLGPFDAVGFTSAVAAEREMVREDQLEEMIGTVSQTFLGLTVNCARCHDHKFDPIPQRDYYRFKAALEGVWQPVVDNDLKADGTFLLTSAEAREREARIRRIEARIAKAEAGLRAAFRAARRALPAPVSHIDPSLAARWSFDAGTDDDSGNLHASYAEAAAVADGRLRPAEGRDAVTITTPHLDFDLREKTLEAWVWVRKSPEKPAAVVRIRNDSGFRGFAFDAIQFAGGKQRQWENMSSSRFRSHDVKGDPENAEPGSRVHLAITYSGDGSIRIYRNGKPYGEAYTPDQGIAGGRLQTYGRGDARVELTASAELELEEARIYRRALTAEDVAASYAGWRRPLTEADLLAAMPEASRIQVSEWRRDLAAARQELAGMKTPEKAFAATPRHPEPTRLLLRGDVNRKGDVMSPGAISCLKASAGEFILPPDAPDGDRRRKLAEWIASPSNPLFARVMVNRVWRLHFGTGLVENPNDFGYNGGRPSHPELLDALAGEFVRGGWSIKKLHRMILLSQTYRQSSAFRPEAAERDADNRLYWRFSPQRLSAEPVRDAMLAASGAINSKMFGPSFRPFTISKNKGSYASYVPVESDDPELFRRTVYRMNVNSGGNPLLDSLDCPVPSVKTPRRSVTTTALQALSLMNNAFVNRQAAALAARLTREGGGAAAQIDRGFRLTLGRPPRPEEAASAAELVAAHGLEPFCWGLFNTTEFLYVR